MRLGIACECLHAHRYPQMIEQLRRQRGSRRSDREASTGEDERPAGCRNRGAQTPCTTAAIQDTRDGSSYFAR
jgi:hypothetical protein